MPTHRPKGLSLIELIVALAIVSILATLIYPSFTHQIRKGELTSAKADIASLTSLMEEHYKSHFRYPDISNTDPVTNFFPSWRAQSDDFHYTILSDSANYQISATGTSSIVGSCRILVNQANQCAVLSCGALSEQC